MDKYPGQVDMENPQMSICDALQKNQAPATADTVAGAIILFEEVTASSIAFASVVLAL